MLNGRKLGNSKQLLLLSIKIQSRCSDVIDIDGARTVEAGLSCEGEGILAQGKGHGRDGRREAFIESAKLSDRLDEARIGDGIGSVEVLFSIDIRIV